MDFPMALKDVKAMVDKELLRFFSEKRIEAEKIHPQTTQLVDQIADFTTRGGKRTRAFLVWVGHESTVKGKRKKEKGSVEDDLLSAMMAIELFQSFALIHDDIIDEDTFRRGSPTVHEHFKSKVISHKSKVRSAQRFGESMAILAGDLALVWADELMEKGKRKTEKGKIEEIYRKMKQEMILGQSLDVLASVGLPSADQATINRYKTAWYSVVRPLQIGAAAAGADEKMLEAFVPYGLAVGEAYQLRDDFLDGAISEVTFQTQSTMYENQVNAAAQAIRARTNIAALLADFAHFALNRQA